MLRCPPRCSNLAWHVNLSTSRALLATSRSPTRPLSTSPSRSAPDRAVGSGVNINIETDLDHTLTPESNASGPILEPTLPPPTNKDHHDLPSFLAHSRRTGVSTTSNTYRGTYYEYLTASTLRRYGFELVRVGGRGDKGIDLVGTWTIPDMLGKTNLHPTKDSKEVQTDSKVGEYPTQKLRVLVQCKRMGLKTTKAPHLIRELEGAAHGVSVPVGWRGPGVLSILVASRGATKGVRDAMAGSRRAMGWIMLEPKDQEDERGGKTDGEEMGIVAEESLESGQFREEEHKGKVRQILWNKAASALGLEGLEVVTRYDGVARSVGSDGPGRPIQEAVLMWHGKIQSAADGEKDQVTS